jgi:hypothetical protein
VQQPPAVGARHGDPDVAVHVPVQRHEQQVVEAGEGADVGEAEPLVATRRLHHPVRPVLPLPRHAARAHLGRRRVLHRREPGLRDVHGGLGEVAQPAGVIAVEVGERDVPDVGRREPQRLHLRERRFLGQQIGRHVLADQRVQRLLGPSDIIRAEPGSGHPAGMTAADFVR